MPEAAVDKDDLAPSLKDDVWLARDVLVMEGVGYTKRVQYAARCELWLRVSVTDPAHSFASFGSREWVIWPIPLGVHVRPLMLWVHDAAMVLRRRIYVYGLRLPAACVGLKVVRPIADNVQLCPAVTGAPPPS